MEGQKLDLIVIGAGPGGYVAAIRAAQLGLKVACVEKEDRLGGTCLRVGCIPSKALLESSERLVEARQELEAHGIRAGRIDLDLAAMMRRKERIVGQLTRGIDGLFLKRKIERVLGHACLEGPGKVKVGTDKGEVRLEAPSIIIATGSQAASLPGIQCEGKRIVTSTEALSFDEVPKRLVVIGAGYIGLELGSVWRRLGAEVTVLEYLDRILPGMDAELASEAQKIFEKQGLRFDLGCKVTSAKAGKGKATVAAEGGKSWPCDRVLMAVGRKPNTEGLGLESASIQLDERGRISVDEHYATSAPGVYAIGDVIRGPMLAHKAEEEGVACVEQIVTGHGHVNAAAIPGVVYTQPELASVGKTEEELKEEKREYRKGVFPFRANGRAHALGTVEGKVKILADAETDRILGVHILGPRAGDLIAEAVAAIQFGASSEDVARTIHAHPTLAEAIKEAALAVDGRVLHL